MPEAKTLAVGVAILTILGMTLALAVPIGPSLTGDDDPENSGVTSAQEDPTNNTTDNDTDDNSTDTDNDGDDDDPEDNDGSGENGSSDSPPCESNDDSNGESDCGSDGDGTDDQDGEKDKDKDGDDTGDDGTGDDGSDGDGSDGADDQDGEKDKDGGDGDDGTGDDGNETDDGDDGNETDVIGTCEENGLVMNNTIANEAFGTENESGPISEQLHENEEQFQDAYVIIHEGSCVIATVDNNANGGDDGGPSDQLPGGDNGTDGNETDDGDETDGELGTCETGGAVQENTLANEIFGTENEDGPLSSALHDNEAQFQDGQVLVHEGSCVIATVDNNASGGGGDLPESP